MSKLWRWTWLVLLGLVLVAVAAPAGAAEDGDDDDDGIGMLYAEGDTISVSGSFVRVDGRYCLDVDDGPLAGNRVTILESPQLEQVPTGNITKARLTLRATLFYGQNFWYVDSLNSLGTGEIPTKNTKLHIIRDGADENQQNRIERREEQAREKAEKAREKLQKKIEQLREKVQDYRERVRENKKKKSNKKGGRDRDQERLDQAEEELREAEQELRELGNETSGNRESDRPRRVEIPDSWRDQFSQGQSVTYVGEFGEQKGRPCLRIMQGNLDGLLIYMLEDSFLEHMANDFMSQSMIAGVRVTAQVTKFQGEVFLTVQRYERNEG